MTPRFALAWLATVLCSVAWGLDPAALALDRLEPFVAGLKNPAALCYGPGGLLFVTELGEAGLDGDGQVTVIDQGRPRRFAHGLDDPRGIAYYKGELYVAEKTRLVKLDADGNPSDYAVPADFPSPPRALRSLAVDSQEGIFVVVDAGDPSNSPSAGAIYRIDARLHKIELLADRQSTPELQSPQGIVFDGASHALVADARGVARVKFADRSAQRIIASSEIGEADSLAWDHFGRLFISSTKTGRIFGVPRPGQRPVLLGEAPVGAALAAVDAAGKSLIVLDPTGGGALSRASTTIPGWEVDENPAPAALEPAFPRLEWTGWSDGSDTGKITPLRPIVLTHAGDGSNRVFVATEQGVIHVFENSDAAAKTRVFLDLTDRVRYNDNQNEEGFLGLAFHPHFAQTGELFVFYTLVNAPATNVLSRFRLKPGSTDEADPASEEQLIRFDKPYWNHDGGTVAFGPDGYLYVTHGDGGAANDPHGNGQNLATLLGKTLRIDIDHRSEGKNYSIPRDNPVADRPGAAPEIWCYGLRNVWRMAFDRQTGQLWAADVGQNMFEEINLLRAGGDYGWNLREAEHPFGANGVDLRPDLVEPIWEYDHDIGKSITGGFVYRGQQVPALSGAYLYADYVTTRMWALRYDPARGRVVANQPVKNPGLAVMSFGEDEQGEAYALTASPNGRGIHRIVKAAAD